MAAIHLMTVPIKVVLKTGKKEETYNIEVREYERSERKALEKNDKKVKDLLYRLNRISSQYESAKKKAEYAEKLEDYKKALKFEERADELAEQLEAISEEVNKLGANDYAEKKAQKAYDLLISGEDKEALKEKAEGIGFDTIMRLIFDERQKVVGKQQEE